MVSSLGFMVRSLIPERGKKLLPRGQKMKKRRVDGVPPGALNAAIGGF
jgi:hypothetical protein